jgi:hypothetical protein
MLRDAWGALAREALDARARQATTARQPSLWDPRTIARKVIESVAEPVQSVNQKIQVRAKELLKETKWQANKLSEVDRRAVAELAQSRGVPLPLHSARYKGRPLLELYRYETIRWHHANPFFGSVVQRLTAVQQEDHRAYVDDNGLLRSAKDRSLIDTAAAQIFRNRPLAVNDAAPATPTENSGIFVMDKKGNLYVSNHQRAGEFHHSTLANGRSVAAAGSLAVVNGQIRRADCDSGHYKPDRDAMLQLRDELTRKKVPPFPVFNFDGRKRLF